MLLRHSARLLSRAAGKRARRSAWTGYMEGSVYSPAALQRKEAVARAALEEFRPRAVLDVGCNIGHFSALAAGSGAAVVAIDRDGAVVDATFERARREGLDILPLVVDLARPTPAVGWRNGECPSFLERARGKFDGVLMLAVLHHLAVTEGITIEEILSLTAELTSRVAVIEYVEPTDPMFLRLARGRDHYRGLDRLHFEAVCRRHFEVLRVEPMPDTKRWLYVLGRR
jgi:SAM-dependent methyltransferase